MKKILSDQNRYRYTNICLVVLSKGETRELVGEAKTKVIMAKTFSQNFRGSSNRRSQQIAKQKQVF